MKLLVAADIFGETPELHSVAKAFCGNYAVVSPYENPRRQFSSEKHAYSAFLSAGGIRSYVAKLASEINIYKPDALVGFSVGATAGWITLADSRCRDIQLGVLFYGSRIRDHLQLRPQCPTRLLFAEHESACDTKALVTELQTSGMSAEVSAGSQHGFMNERSPGYDLPAKEKGIDWARAALDKYF